MLKKTQNTLTKLSKNNYLTAKTYQNSPVQLALEHFTLPNPLNYFKGQNNTQIQNHKIQPISKIENFIKKNTKIQKGFKLDNQKIGQIKDQLLRNDIIYLNTDFSKYTRNQNNSKELLRRIHSEFLLELGQQLGSIRTHNDDPDSFVWNIKPEVQNNNDNNQDKQHQCRSHTDQEFRFHTDCSYEQNPPEFLGISVIQKDNFGFGLSSILKVSDILNMMDQKNVEILKQKDYKIKVPLDFYKGIDHIVDNIVLDSKKIRYRHDIIDRSDLSEEQLGAFNQMYEIIDKNECINLHQMENDTVVLFNNQTFLHARTQIQNKNRHLLRIRFDI